MPNALSDSAAIQARTSAGPSRGCNPLPSRVAGPSRHCAADGAPSATPTGAVPGAGSPPSGSSVASSRASAASSSAIRSSSEGGRRVGEPGTAARGAGRQTTSGARADSGAGAGSGACKEAGAEAGTGSPPAPSCAGSAARTGVSGKGASGTGTASRPPSSGSTTGSDNKSGADHAATRGSSVRSGPADTESSRPGTRAGSVSTSGGAPAPAGRGAAIPASIRTMASGFRTSLRAGRAGVAPRTSSGIAPGQTACGPVPASGPGSVASSRSRRRIDASTPSISPFDIWPDIAAPPGHPARACAHPPRLTHTLPAEDCTPTTQQSVNGCPRHRQCTAAASLSRMVLPVRIELTTSPLPRECSTTELRQRAGARRPDHRGRRRWRSSSARAPRVQARCAAPQP